mmetsp:Transcript_12204/g.14448  ORF Transcript_12204/g.14448 Transcript_12204/m.14448 type:complete len:180 (-) Transcript_12204:7-546(-)
MWCFRERDSSSSSIHNEKQNHIELQQQSAAEIQCESDLNLKASARLPSAPGECKIQMNTDHVVISNPKDLQYTVGAIQAEIKQIRCHAPVDEGYQKNKNGEEKTVSPAEEKVKREQPVTKPHCEKSSKERHGKISVTCLKNKELLITNRFAECSITSESSGDGLGSPVIIEIPDVLVQS